MDSLAANPSGSGVYGNPSEQPVDYQGPLSIVNQLKDREMQDFQKKAQFMSDLSLRQNRLQRIYDNIDRTSSQSQQGGSPTQGMNTVAGFDPNAMTGYEKGELGVRQQQANTESQRQQQQATQGQEAINIKSEQEKLNQQKSDQINQEKQADMQRKITESEAKIKQAQDALAAKNTNAEAQLQAHKDLATAMEERHKLELAQKDAAFQESKKQHQAQIDDMQKKLDEASHSETTTEVDASGNKKTVTTNRGSQPKTVKGTGKDGKQYDVPVGKIDDWNQNHAQLGTEIQAQ